MLLLKGVKFNDLQNLLNFIYNGEVRMPQNQIASFLTLAEDLQIKGLTHEKAAKIREATLKRPLPVVRSKEGPPAKAPRPSVAIKNPPTTDTASPTAARTDLQVETEQNDFLENYIEEIAEEQEEDDPDEMFEDYGGIGLPTYGKVFNPNDLIKVLPSDDNKPQAECNSCHMLFKSPPNCRAHVLRMHAPPVFFQCKICDKVTKGSSMFRDHVQKRHGVRGVHIVENYAKIPSEEAIASIVLKDFPSRS